MTLTTPTVPSVTIVAPAHPGVAEFNGAGSDFVTNLPPVGSSFPLNGAAVQLTSTAVADANIGTITATYRGNVMSGGVAYPTFDLSIPALSLTATGVRGDGTSAATSNGGTINTTLATMTYTLFGAWTYTPPGGGQAYIGQLITGYGTPAGGVPLSGSATYTSTTTPSPGGGGGGGVIVAYFVPSGTGTVQGGTLSGNASINVNFASNMVNGTLSNMMATPAGSSTATPWNTVSLSGPIDRGPIGVSAGGQTTTTGAPANAGTAGFSSGATGNFVAQFYGPTGQELGGVWTLAEQNSTNGKSAFGMFGAHQ